MNKTMTRYRVAVKNGWLGSAGHMCDIDGVATTREAFAACFSNRDEAEAAAKAVGGTVEAGTLVNYRFVKEA